MAGPAAAPGPPPRPFAILLRFFLGRAAVDDALSPSGGDLSGTLGRNLALVAGPGIVVPFLVAMKYAYLNGFAPHLIPAELWFDRCFFVSYALAVAGVVTALQWDELTLDRRDHAVLGTLPIRPGTVRLASLTAQALFPLLFFVAANAGAVLLLPAAQTLGRPAAVTARYAAAHAGAALAATATAYLATLSVKGLLDALLGHRLAARAAPGVQAALAGGWLALLLLSSEVARAGSGAEGGRRGLVGLLPPLWFAGLYEHLAGEASPARAGLAATSLRALGAAAAAFGAATLLGWRSAALDGPPEPVPPRPTPRLTDRILDRLVLRSPPERAGFRFLLATLLRSRRHRLVLAAAAAVALALALASAVPGPAAPDHAGPRRSDFDLPLLFSFCLLLGARHASRLPAEPQAGWVFTFADPAQAPELWRGLRRALTVAAVLPPVLLAYPVSALRLGPAAAALHHLHALALALLLQELLFLRFDRVPATTPTPATGPGLKLTWPLYLVLFWLWVSLPSGMSPWLLAEPWRLVTAVGAEAGAVALLRRERRRFLCRRGFVLDADPERLVLGLGLA